MSYYIRVLGTANPSIHLDELLTALEDADLQALVSIAEEEQPDNWSIIEIANDKGETLTQIERNAVVEGELGKDELEEFREEIADCRPASAAGWLNKYLDNIKVIYAFQLLNNAFEGDNYAIITTIKEKIWNRTGGVLQADGEGFSNEDGYHITFYSHPTMRHNTLSSSLSTSGKCKLSVNEV